MPRSPRWRKPRDKLEQLAKQQGEIADKARATDKADDKKANDLAKDQGDLKPQAKEVGDMIKESGARGRQED